MLVITEEAEDPTLLTEDEVATAIGDTSVPSDGLIAISERVSEMIAGACNVAPAGAAVRTLRAETVMEVVRLRSSSTETLYLARRPVIEIISATEGGVAVVDADRELSDSGLLRLRNGHPCGWTCGKVAVEYRAGWEEVPPALKEIAGRLAATLWSNKGRDANLKRERVDGVGEQEWWVDLKADTIVPDDIQAALVRGGFVNLQTMVG